MADMMTRCKCGHTRWAHSAADETCGVVGCECREFAPVPGSRLPDMLRRQEAATRKAIAARAATTEGGART